MICTFAPRCLSTGTNRSSDMPTDGLVVTSESKPDVDVSVVHRDRLEVGQQRLAALLVGSAPRPGTDQRHAAQTRRDRSVRLASALRDQQRHRRVAELVPDRRRDVEHHPRPRGHLVLQGAPVLDPRLVGAHQVVSDLAVDVPDRDNQGGHRTLGAREPQVRQLRLGLRGEVAARQGDLGRDAGLIDQLLVLREESHAVLGFRSSGSRSRAWTKSWKSASICAAATSSWRGSDSGRRTSWGA